MQHVFQIVFYYNKFDYNMDDYIEEITEGPLYATREAAEKHKAWVSEYDPFCKCEVRKVAVREDFEPRR